MFYWIVSVKHLQKRYDEHSHSPLASYPGKTWSDGCQPQGCGFGCDWPPQSRWACADLVMSGFFYNLGRQLGRRVVPAVRKSKWIWDGLTGSEEESLRAERALGASLAAELRATTEALNDLETAQWLNDL